MKFIHAQLLAVLFFSSQAMADDSNLKTILGGGVGAAAGTAIGGVVGGKTGEVVGGAVGGGLGGAVTTKGEGQAGAVIGGAAGGAGGAVVGKIIAEPEKSYGHNYDNRRHYKHKHGRGNAYGHDDYYDRDYYEHRRHDD
jgi:hypothetical protein